MDMSDVTIGTKSFYRPERIKWCLESIYQTDLGFNEVIVADDGEITEEKKEIFQEYKEKLDLKVLDLKYDYGLGGSRNRVFQEMNGEYLLWVDDDMSVPANVTEMKRVLEKKDDLGGVSGAMFQEGDYRIEAHDFKFSKGIFGKTLIKDVEEGNVSKEKVETLVGEKTLYKFDLVLNCLLLKKSCLKDGKWDDRFIISGEHTDFFLNHYMNTEWEFGVMPDVVFNHYPGGSIEFNDERNDENKKQNSIEILKDKWNIDNIAFRRKFYEGRSSGGISTKIKKKLPLFLLSYLQEKNILPLRQKNRVEGDG